MSIATGFTRTQLESLLSIERLPRALEDPLNRGGEPTATVGDTVVDPDAEQAYERVLDKMEIRQVGNLADHLNERERDVIRAHYGLGGPQQTLNQIGGALGLTAERARQIEVGALNKLRTALAQPALSVGEQT